MFLVLSNAKSKAHEQHARQQIAKLLEKGGEALSEKDLHKLFDLCDPAQFDPAWLGVFTEVRQLEAEAAKVAETLSDRQAAKTKAEAALQQAERQRDEAIRAVELEVANASARLHAAKLAAANAQDAGNMVAGLRESFGPLFGTSADFGNVYHINQLPARLAAAARAAGLPDRQTGKLPPIADQEAVAAHEAEQRRQIEERQQAAIVERNRQRREAMAAQPAMSKE